MANGIQEPKLRSIMEILSGDTRYIVPKYQRSFAWEEDDEVKELWEDILDAVKNSRADYFLGTIVFQSKGAGQYEIIDGQQRLMCISMIASAVRNIFKARNDGERAERIFGWFLGSIGIESNSIPKPKLELNKVNNPIYLRYIVESADFAVVAEALRDKSLHNSNQKLLAAYKFFLDQIGEEAKRRGTQLDDFVVPLIDCLRSSIKLITITVSSEEDAYLVFESLNARGQELAVSDLVKNRLYHEVGGSNVQRAQQFWEQMETDLARRPIPEFLRHYWIAKKADAKNLAVREKQLYRLIVKDVNSQQKATSLLSDLKDSAGDYARITDYSLWPDDSNYDLAFERSLEELKLFRVSQCYPVLLNAIQVFNTPQKIAKTFRIITDFSFRYNIVGNGTSGSLERIFGEIAYGIRAGTHSSPNEVADALRGYNTDAKFRSDFELLSLPKSKAKLARYILSKLNDAMEGGEQVASMDPKKVNLEHILPQNPSPAWRTDFPKGDYADYVERLGNLTLLASRINRDAGDKSFQDKQQLAFTSSKLPINAFLKKAAKWGSEEIEQRQGQMAKMALQAWKI